MKSTFTIGGYFEVDVIRDGVVVDTLKVKNVVTREAKAYLLRSGVTAEASPSTAWYVGLIGFNVNPTELDTAATALGSSGTYGEVTAYTETNRPSYQATFSNNAISNANTPAAFTINANTTVYGVFITNTSVKQSNTGVLLCAGKFTNARSLANGDILAIRYTISTTT